MLTTISSILSSAAAAAVEGRVFGFGLLRFARGGEAASESRPEGAEESEAEEESCLEGVSRCTAMLWRAAKSRKRAAGSRGGGGLEKVVGTQDGRDANSHRNQGDGKFRDAVRQFLELSQEAKRRKTSASATVSSAAASCQKVRLRWCGFWRCRGLARREWSGGRQARRSGAEQVLRIASKSGRFGEAAKERGAANTNREGATLPGEKTASAGRCGRFEKRKMRRNS